MKIERPLYQIAVRGVLFGVGTFRNTRYGAVLTRTPTATQQTTQARATAQRRFASLAEEFSFYADSSAETIAQYLTRRLSSINASAGLSQTRGFFLSTNTTTTTPAAYAKTTTQPRSLLS